MSLMSPIIKVCGMREADNIRAVEQLLTEHATLRSSLAMHRPPSTPQDSTAWIGFIFWPHSKRYVREKPAYLPVNAKRVGVFVDQDAETVERVARDFALDIIQLHGHESPEYVRQLHNWTIIKAFNIANASDLSATAPYEGIADYFLFDTKGKAVGGNGEKFKWSVLAHYDGQTPFLLSGGIGPLDATLIKAFHHPLLAGIDLNSRFEIAPGIKDTDALRAFLNELTINT